MKYFTTSLGRLVAEHERGTLFEDLILKVLYDYRTNPFNASNFPMRASALAKASHLELPLARSVADALVEKGLVEKATALPGVSEEGYRITGSGVVFVLNVPQGLQGVM